MWALAHILGLIFFGVVAQEPPPVEAPSAVTPAASEAAARVPSDKGQVKEFAPGVTIDWKAKTVTVDARVVLREGPLELLMCRAGTKEHESILATTVRAQDIFQAMGLIGLEPGKPVRWDDSGEKLLAPTGQKLTLTVHCDGTIEPHAVEKWLLQTEKEPVKGPLKWVFAGSKTVSDKHFGADVEGTYVCVVDFDTALISVGSLHTSDDGELWLRANPSTIPERGTRCRLTIAAAGAAAPTSTP